MLLLFARLCQHTELDTNDKQYIYIYKTTARYTNRRLQFCFFLSVLSFSRTTNINLFSIALLSFIVLLKIVSVSVFIYYPFFFQLSVEFSDYRILETSRGYGQLTFWLYKITAITKKKQNFLNRRPIFCTNYIRTITIRV